MTYLFYMENLISYTISSVLDLLTSSYCSYILVLLAISGAFSLVYKLTGRSSGK